MTLQVFVLQRQIVEDRVRTINEIDIIEDGDSSCFDLSEMAFSIIW